MTTCPICNIDSNEVLLEEKNVLQCKECDAIFKKEPPNHKKQLSTNTNGNSLRSIKEKIGKNVIGKRFWNLVAEQYVDYLKQKTNMNFKKAIDIGALYGHFVSKLNDQKIDTVGLEADKTHVKSAVTNKISVGYFDENYPIETKYDLICLTQMIYYVSNPIAVLNHAKKMLETNGLIFISTQNPSSSFIKEKKIPEIIESGMNILLSKKNFEFLKTKIGLELIDYTTYRPEIYLQRFSSQNNKDEFLNYLKFHWQKPYRADPDGHHAFLLLKPLS